MDQLRAIHYFIKVAELGSFIEASRVLGVPASSVSRRLQDLEAELGVTLLSRTTRTVRLTELGQLYLDRVRPTVDELRYTNELVKNHLASPSGTLRISAITGYGEYRLVPALRRLRRQFPDLVVDLDLTDQLMDLTSDDIDIAIRVTASPPERAIARRLNSNNYVLVAAPAYLEARACPGVWRTFTTIGPCSIVGRIGSFTGRQKPPVGGQRSTQTRLSFAILARNWSPKPRPGTDWRWSRAGLSKSKSPKSG